METDDEMEEVADEPFFGEEIDLDYEFDAAMYYDFTRPETEMEISEAEEWFKIVGSYPPSRKHFLFSSSFASSRFRFYWISVINVHVMELFCSVEFGSGDNAFSWNGF